MFGAVRDGGSELDTKRLERRMMLYYTQDGLWDLFVGVCATGWGLLLGLDLIALVGVICGSAGVLVVVLRQQITHPRVGYVKFRPAGRYRSVIAALVAGLAAGILVVTTARTGLGELIRPLFAVWTGLAVGTLLAAAGWAFNARRFYAYGALIALAGAVHQWMGVPLWLAVATAGAVIIVSGLVVLSRFLKHNPKVDVDAIG